MKFSANLGFLFTEHTLPEAIREASKAGFDAVECHFPYEVPTSEVRAALAETGFRMLGLNTRPGDMAAGDFGLAALPDRKHDAQVAILEAIGYAAEIGAENIHVMAGKTGGAAEAEATFRDNLKYACDHAAEQGKTILIEPINHKDVPGYHLSTTDHAAGIISDLGRSNLKLMFDCYHTQIMEGGLPDLVSRHLPIIGHIQIAAVPDRGEPDQGELEYAPLLKHILEIGYDAPIGAEYKPRSGKTSEGLGWLAEFGKF